MPSNAMPPSGARFIHVAATSGALAVLAVAVFLLVRNQPVADPRLFFVLRVLLSFSAAALGAKIPGFLNIRWSGSGLVVRAGGALALFALTFLFTPDLLVDQAGKPPTSISAPGGVAAQSIDNSPITIDSPTLGANPSK